MNENDLQRLAEARERWFYAESSPERIYGLLKYLDARWLVAARSDGIAPHRAARRWRALHHIVEKVFLQITKESFLREKALSQSFDYVPRPRKSSPDQTDSGRDVRRMLEHPLGLAESMSEESWVGWGSFNQKLDIILEKQLTAMRK
jgi:hypothetical protein